ncbi:hypothetical protein BDB00DRAFT_482089 [Zychaea mexicana]|uniref:uncharacterized protein n=1 Tax=Zychaea mexicana TaxID=64656 RepID=UPI0022FE2779|nr:uncharacterized protein BDB00DRAFT_482089 [Zychaea mexicana]KAI9491614.1 hypothetical protein BDB00DRAFT_482089 [Zychaea mexicana]
MADHLGESTIMTCSVPSCNQQCILLLLFFFVAVKPFFFAYLKKERLTLGYHTFSFTPFFPLTHNSFFFNFLVPKEMQLYHMEARHPDRRTTATATTSTTATTVENSKPLQGISALKVGQQQPLQCQEGNERCKAIKRRRRRRKWEGGWLYYYFNNTNNNGHSAKKRLCTCSC